jgi:hypothetical protein
MCVSVCVHDIGGEYVAGGIDGIMMIMMFEKREKERESLSQLDFPCKYNMHTYIYLWVYIWSVTSYRIMIHIRENIFNSGRRRNLSLRKKRSRKMMEKLSHQGRILLGGWLENFQFFLNFQTFLKFINCFSKKILKSEKFLSVKS